MKKFSIYEALRFGWTVTLDNFPFLLGILLASVAVTTGFQVLSGLASNNPLLDAGFGLLSIIIGTLISIGVITATLKLVNGEKPHFRELFNQADLFIPYFVTYLLYSIIVLIGFLPLLVFVVCLQFNMLNDLHPAAIVGGMILLIIPGVYLSLVYLFSQFLSIDKKMEPFHALKRSSRITKGNRWYLFLFILALSLVNIVGALALILGLALTVPTTWVALVYVYKKLELASA